MRGCFAEKLKALLYFTTLSSLFHGTAQQALTADDRASRPVTVADAVRMTKLGLPNEGVSQFSPDGQKFVVVLRKGDPENNTNEYSLLLWRTEELFHSSAPELLLRMSSSSNREALAHLNWLSDNETLAFLGEHPGELRQLYSFNTRTHALRKLTDHPTNVLSYSLADGTKKIAYTAEEPVSSIFDENALRHGVVVSAQDLFHLLAGRKGTWLNAQLPQLFLKSDSNKVRLINTSDMISLWSNSPFLSPDGRYVLVVTLARDIPGDWIEYSDPRIRRFVSAKLNPGQYSYLDRYTLVDTKTAESRVLLNAPTTSAYLGEQVAWAPDSRTVVIAGAHLPLDGAAGEERKARASTAFVVELRVPTGEFTKVTDEQDLRLLGWDSRGDQLNFEAGSFDTNFDARPRMATAVVCRKVGGTWEKPTAPLEHPRLRIVLEEDMNTPPKLSVIDDKRGRKDLLLDLNPEFSNLRFSKVEEIRWRGTDGHEVRGGLYFPLSFTPGTRYPLVIQTHGWSSQQFWIDGPWTTAFAAQPLAGKGIMVLQVDENYDDMGTQQEVRRETASFEGAIDDLSEKGLVDRDRVGIVGFSRTCLFVKYALTHSKYRFAAATVTSGVDGGYIQYMLHANANPEMNHLVEGMNGGLPIGESLKTWMERSPGFNLDKVQTPLLITVEKPEELLYEWEWFAGLTRLGKPVEMVMMQDGSHMLQKPWERMISDQGTVDWFSFWLKNEEDSDASKAEQYARWHELRKQQEHSQFSVFAPAR